MAKTEEVTVLSAKPGTLTKDSVPQLLQIVNQKISALTKTEEVKKITEPLEHFGPIDKINTIGALISAHSSLVNREKFYNESAEILIGDKYGKKAPVFKVKGHSVKEWTTQLQARVDYLINKKELDHLNKTKATLESHLSEDLKLQKDLESIQKNLLNDELI